MPPRPRRGACGRSPPAPCACRPRSRPDAGTRCRRSRSRTTCSRAWSSRRSPSTGSASASARLQVTEAGVGPLGERSASSTATACRAARAPARRRCGSSPHPTTASCPAAARRERSRAVRGVTASVADAGRTISIPTGGVVVDDLRLRRRRRPRGGGRDRADQPARQARASGCRRGCPTPASARGRCPRSCPRRCARWARWLIPPRRPAAGGTSGPRRRPGMRGARGQADGTGRTAIVIRVDRADPARVVGEGHVPHPGGAAAVQPACRGRARCPP